MRKRERDNESSRRREKRRPTEQGGLKCVVLMGSRDLGVRKRDYTSPSENTVGVKVGHKRTGSLPKVVLVKALHSVHV